MWALAWPAVALNSLQVVNSLLDSGFIGHLDKAALAAYGAVTAVIFLLFSLAMSLATGPTALVSRAFGAGKPEEYREACRQSVSLALLCGLMFAAIGYVGAPYAVVLLLPAEAARAAELGTAYLRIFCAGLPAIYLIQALAGSMRGIGDTRSPMVISGLQILLHIALNFLFIFPPRTLGGAEIPGLGLGLPGGALALTASAWVAAIAYIVYAGFTPLGPNGRFTWPKPDWATRIMRIAVPASVMAVLRVLSLMVFTYILALTANGETALAAMRPGFAIESLMFMPSFGLSMAAAALVGQSLGMQRPDRAEKLGWVAGHSAATVTLAVSVPVFLFAESIASVMIVDKPAIVAEATMLIRFLCVTEIGFAYAMVMIGAMQGAGDTVRPLWITIVALWAIRVPLTWALVLPAGMGSAGAWIAMSATQFLQGLMAVIAFRQGGWKTKEV